MKRSRWIQLWRVSSNDRNGIRDSAETGYIDPLNLWLMSSDLWVKRWWNLPEVCPFPSVFWNGNLSEQKWRIWRLQLKHVTKQGNKNPGAASHVIIIPLAIHGWFPGIQDFVSVSKTVFFVLNILEFLGVSSFLDVWYVWFMLLKHQPTYFKVAPQLQYKFSYT